MNRLKSFGSDAGYEGGALDAHKFKFHQGKGMQATTLQGLRGSSPPHPLPKEISSAVEDYDSSGSDNEGPSVSRYQKDSFPTSGRTDSAICTSEDERDSAHHYTPPLETLPCAARRSYFSQHRVDQVASTIDMEMDEDVADEELDAQIEYQEQLKSDLLSDIQTSRNIMASSLHLLQLMRQQMVEQSH